jgi:hypothetical protein
VNLSALSTAAVHQALTGNGLALRIGAFNVSVISPIASVAEHILCLYPDFAVVGAGQFIDFHVGLTAPWSPRRYWHPQVNFSFDGHRPFKPLPYAQAAAFFEWGLNWCIASQSNQYLIIHAAVVEHNGQAFILPGSPGSGKSTLCAALVCRGWRLLSDEMALLSMADGLIYPAPRPVSLKNQSLDVIRAFSAEAVIGPIVNDTLKGTVGHLRPPAASVAASAYPARAAQIIFPKYYVGSTTVLEPLSKARTLLELAEHCFNYSALGKLGFAALGDLCDVCACHQFQYSDLEEAIALFTRLATPSP